MRHAVVVITGVVLCMAPAWHVVADDVATEIAQLKREIARVASQRRDEGTQAERDRREYAAYRERIASRKQEITGRTDSLRALAGQTVRKNDSLTAQIDAASVKLREQELVRDRLRRTLHAAVTALATQVGHYPPLVREQYSGAVGYLAAEIDNRSVDHTEALYRLMRIVQDLRTVSQEIVVVEGTSPVLQMRGTVYRLRIGGVFEAAVDAEGSAAYRWNGPNGSADTIWHALTASEAASILQAVRIREGRTVPDLVNIPFAAPPQPTTAGGRP